MMLLTKANRAALPPLYAQEDKGADAIVHVKFFTPWSNWTWYATEGSLDLTWYDTVRILRLEEMMNDETRREILCDLWQQDKSQALPCNITALDLWHYLQKQISSENKRAHIRKRSREPELERREMGFERLRLSLQSFPSVQSEGICQAGNPCSREEARQASPEERNSPSHRRQYTRRQSGESGGNDEGTTSDSPYSQAQGDGQLQRLPPAPETGQPREICQINDFLFFGLVDGHVKELGYFSLAELSALKGPYGLKVERDRYWEPKRLRDIAPAHFEEHTPQVEHDPQWLGALARTKRSGQQ